MLDCNDKKCLAVFAPLKNGKALGVLLAQLRQGCPQLEPLDGRHETSIVGQH